MAARLASALTALAAAALAAEPTDCLVCQKMVRALSTAPGCEGNPCELDNDLVRLDRCHERAEGVAAGLHAAGAALEPAERRGDYKLARSCDDLRSLPSHVLCVRHGVCLSRCEVRARAHAARRGARTTPRAMGGARGAGVRADHRILARSRLRGLAVHRCGGRARAEPGAPPRTARSLGAARAPHRGPPRPAVRRNRRSTAGTR